MWCGYVVCTHVKMSVLMLSVYIKSILVFEEGYLSRCFGSLFEESTEQTAFFLQTAGEETLHSCRYFLSH